MKTFRYVMMFLALGIPLAALADTGEPACCANGGSACCEAGCPLCHHAR